MEKNNTYSNSINDPCTFNAIWRGARKTVNKGTRNEKAPRTNIRIYINFYTLIFL